MPRLIVLAPLALAITLAGCADPDAPPAPPAPPEAAAVPADSAPVTAEIAANRALNVGDRAPDFALPGVHGQTIRLSSLLEEGPVVLTFYRGTWCPYCNTQLHDYQENLPEIEAAGARLVAVSPQVPDSSLSMQEKNALTFPVLSDVGSLISRAYGLVFQVDDATRDRYEAVGIDLARSNGTDTWELPVPATYVIAPDGTIRAAFVEADYTQRASVRQILDALAAA